METENEHITALLNFRINWEHLHQVILAWVGEMKRGSSQVNAIFAALLF